MFWVQPHSTTSSLSFLILLAPSWMLPTDSKRADCYPYFSLAFGICICKLHILPLLETEICTCLPIEQQGHSQYPIFGSTSDPAKSGKGLGLATSLVKENIHTKQQCVSCAAGTVSPSICWGSTQDLVSTRRSVSCPFVFTPCYTVCISLCGTCSDLAPPFPFCVSAYADIVLDLPHALKRIFSAQDSDWILWRMLMRPYGF